MKGGDFGAPFDPFDADAWNDLSHQGAWARVTAWKAVSAPKRPPSDRTVRVAAKLTWLRGDRALLPARVGAHESLARDTERAVASRLNVSVGVSRVAGQPYVEEGIAIDAEGGFGFLGECASRVSDSAARAFRSAFIDEAVVAPAIEQWLSTGDADGLVSTLKHASQARR